MDMGAENGKTFRHYFDRMRNGIRDWTTYVREKLTHLDDESPWSRTPNRKAMLKHQWCTFVRMGRRLAMYMGTLPDSPVIIRTRSHRELVFAMLSQNRMGLGP